MTDAPLAAPKGFSHFAIRVTDLGRSVEFYSRVLGFDVFDDLRDDPRLPRVFGTITRAGRVRLRGRRHGRDVRGVEGARTGDR